MTEPSPIISDRGQLADWMAAGARPSSDWRIGTEHEKFAFTLDDLRPVPYEGERSIRALLEGLRDQHAWRGIEEDGKLIALDHPDGASITLEPAGQFELSGAQLEHLHQTCAEVNTHLAQVKSVADPLGIGFLGMGFQPKWARQDMPWMPKGRYAIMRDYMPKRGGLGLDMMTRTCTVQVNLDFSSEADMVRKFRVALALQPVATALFANSPFTEGKPNGYLSYRSQIWTDTDPDRTGMLDFVFEEGFGFERYVDYLLDVPMYFVYRGGRYLDASGLSFRDFMAGRLPLLPGELPTVRDWSDHATTAFPEVRMKRFLEMRGADAGPWSQLCALPAFWVGLLYDDAALNAAWDLVHDLTLAERHHLRDNVPRLGLKAPFRQGHVLELAHRALVIAADGLARRARRNPLGADERIYLEPLIEFVASGTSLAERKLALYHGPWGQSVDPVFRDCAY